MKETDSRKNLSLQERIIKNYPLLSRKEKKIADYLSQNLRTAFALSTDQLAKNTGISSATIVRFAQHLGFSGFQQLRSQMMDEVKEELLGMSLPSISYVDAYWKDQDDRIYLFSQNKMAREAFEDLFNKTFGKPHKIGLFRLLPPLLGLSSAAWQKPAEQSDYLRKIVHTLPVRSGRSIEIEAPPF